ncbi:MAG: DNRLRE domain-containing protein [Phycisphaerae bacterium]|nr:DNRLRE domain-containing protein [Phycisphaerae bacterium]
MRKSITLMMLVAMVVVFAGVAIGKADLVTVTPDNDSCLRKDRDTNNYGLTNVIRVFSEGHASTYHGLVHFDLSSYSMPTVQSAALRLYKHDATPGGTTVLTMNLYRIKKGNEWVEGTKDAAGGTNNTDVCWRRRGRYSPEWLGSANGCGVSDTDYHATSVGSIQFDSSNASGWYSIDISAACIQAWADDSTENVGLVMIATATGGEDGVVFRSKDYSTAWGPQLDITYTPEPATMTLLLLGLPLALRRRRK